MSSFKAEIWHITRDLRGRDHQQRFLHYVEDFQHADDLLAQYMRETQYLLDADVRVFDDQDRLVYKRDKDGAVTHYAYDETVQTREKELAERTRAGEILANQRTNAEVRALKAEKMLDISRGMRIETLNPLPWTVVRTRTCSPFRSPDDDNMLMARTLCEDDAKRILENVTCPGCKFEVWYRP